MTTIASTTTPARAPGTVPALVRRWRFWTFRHTERRPGWPMHLLPSVYVSHAPERRDDYGRVESLTVSIGVYWLRWQASVTACRAPNKVLCVSAPHSGVQEGGAP